MIWLHELPVRFTLTLVSCSMSAPLAWWKSFSCCSPLCPAPLFPNGKVKTDSSYQPSAYVCARKWSLENKKINFRLSEFVFVDNVFCLWGDSSSMRHKELLQAFWTAVCTRGRKHLVFRVFSTENVIPLEELVPGKCILVWQLLLEVQYGRQWKRIKEIILLASEKEQINGLFNPQPVSPVQ